jgi:predicted adenine nucleotide alpha hydrolase (AANH) superfamily ATPase
MVFDAGADAAWGVSAKECGGSAAPSPKFLEIDFKKRDGFLKSLRRSAELGLYRQPYCGCEFSRRGADEENVVK